MNYFYNQTTRQMVNLFGTIFNNITILKSSKDKTVEYSRIVVPIRYAPKENYMSRMNGETQSQPVQITLPTMSFDLVDMNYTSERQQIPITRHMNRSGNVTYNQFTGVPYDFEFELYVYTRNIDDALQIKEQIVPRFTPDYNLSFNPIPQMAYTIDVPFILKKVTWDIEYENDFSTTRNVVYTFSFTAKGYFWGPTQESKLIRKAHANIYNDPSIQSGYITRINMANGNNGSFKIDDIIFQGNSYKEATAYGKVMNWDAENQTLEIGGVQGTFKQNSMVHASTTNAAYNLVSFDTRPLQLVHYLVVPNPETANIGDDFGFTETIQEFPDI